MSDGSEQGSGSSGFSWNNFATAAMGGGSDIITSLINVGMQKAENRRNREFAERMTREGWSRDDSANQRRVADLRAAGLNPALAAGGASMSSQPAISSARGEAPEVRAAGTLTALQRFQTQAQMDLLAAQIKSINAEADKSESEVKVNESLVEKNEATTQLTNEQRNKVMREAANELLRGDQIQATTAQLNASAKKIAEETKIVGLEGELIKARTSESKENARRLFEEARWNKNTFEERLENLKKDGFLKEGQAYLLKEAIQKANDYNKLPDNIRFYLSLMAGLTKAAL